VEKAWFVEWNERLHALVLALVLGARTRRERLRTRSDCDRQLARIVQSWRTR
jgi:hypothetical protein